MQSKAVVWSAGNKFDDLATAVYNLLGRGDVLTFKNRNSGNNNGCKYNQGNIPGVPISFGLSLHSRY